MAATVISRLCVQHWKVTLSALQSHIISLSSKRNFCASVNLSNAKRYTEKHEWIELDGKIGTVGISDYAQDKLGEIVYIQLPEVGEEVEKDGEAGCLESVKAASDVYSPVAGKIVQVNEKLSSTPNLINTSPLKDGWIFKLDVAEKADVEGLMNEVAYKQYLRTQE